MNEQEPQPRQPELATLLAMAICGACLGAGAGLLLGGWRAAPIGATAGFFLSAAVTLLYVLPRL
jgi:hypothetical protein